jgi:NADPH-dependent F420 reductase
MSRTIAILGGTGPEGTGLAYRWARAGEKIILGSRDAQRAQEIAKAIGEKAKAAQSVTGAENSQAASSADVVVLTVPFAGHAPLLKQLKSVWKAGTILIDATVPLAVAIGGPATQTLGVWAGSAAEQAAELVPQGVSVAAALQNLSAELLSSDHPVDCDVVVCSNDERARQIASELTEKIPGARALNGGRLSNARIVEQITALLITLNMRYKVHGIGVRFTGVPAQDGLKK